MTAVKMSITARKDTAAYRELVAVNEQAVGGILLARPRPGLAHAVCLCTLIQRRVHPLRSQTHLLSSSALVLNPHFCPLLRAKLHRHLTRLQKCGCPGRTYLVC